MKRRDFLKAGALAGAGALVGRMEPARAISQPDPGPLIVSTWKHGQMCNQGGLQILQVAGKAIDAVELGVSIVESDPASTSVGFGGFPNSEGVVQLDAAIMDGISMEVGAVAGIEEIKNPVRVARKVMTETPHVLLVGDGAQQLVEGDQPAGFVDEHRRTVALVAAPAGCYLPIGLQPLPVPIFYAGEVPLGRRRAAGRVCARTGWPARGATGTRAVARLSPDHTGRRRRTPPGSG